MSEKICPNCRAVLKENANFCSKCRTDVTNIWKAEAPAATPEQGYCSVCGASLREGALFCSKCRTRTDNVSPPQTAENKTPLPDGNIAREIKRSPAANELQELVFDVDTQGTAENVFARGYTLKKYISGFKNPRAIISAIVIAVIWGVLGYINRSGKDNTATDILSFITFAKGGTYGNLRQVTGGVFGKALTAAGLCSVFSGGITAALRGMKGIFSRNRMNFGAFICGMGFGALACLFFIGGKGLNGIAVSISGLILSMGMVGDRQSAGSNGNLTGLLAGIGTGFAVSGALASLRGGLFPWAYVICGGVALSGLLLMPFTKGKRGVGK